MKKRVKYSMLSIALTCALVFTAIFCVKALTEACFSLSSAEGEIADTVEVKLNINNNPGITALSLSIAYSSDDLELLSIENAGLFSDSISNGQITDNPVTVSWFASNSSNVSNSGTLAILKFRIKENAVTSIVSVSYDEDNVFNSDFENVFFNTTNATVKVLEKPVQEPTAEPTEAPTETPQGDPCFALSSVSGSIGDEVEINLNVNNNPGITALSLRISYSEEDIELISVNDAGLFENNISNGIIGSNPFVISWFANNSTNNSNSGTLAVLKFRLKDGAQNSVIAVDYDEDNVFTSDFDNVFFNTINANVEIIGNTPSNILGDADGDGEITILDATVIQRYLAAYTVKNPEHTVKCSDVNGDGLDIIDATLIQRYLASFTVNYPIGEIIK